MNMQGICKEWALSFWGYVAGNNVRSELGKSRLKPLLKFYSPANTKDVKCFLGLIGYYRQYIPNILPT
jgi:hypothetical protein